MFIIFHPRPGTSMPYSCLTGSAGRHRVSPRGVPVWTGEIMDGCSGTWLTHPIGIFGLLGRGWGAVVGEVGHVAAHEFVMLFEQEGVNRRELCRRFGIS